MKFIAIIPARFESTRFPGKPLADIKGKSMIQRVYEQAKKVEKLSRVIIATDDQRIIDHCKHIGAEVMMTSNNHRNGTERIAEVMRNIGEEFEVVLNIQGDEPFVKTEQIELLCDMISKEENQIASLAKLISEQRELESINTVKVVMDKNSKALYFSRFAIPFQRQINMSTPHYKHIGMYAFKSNILQELIHLPISPLEQSESLEQLRWLESGYAIGMGITTFDSFGIDSPEDLIEAIKSI